MGTVPISVIYGHKYPLDQKVIKSRDAQTSTSTSRITEKIWPSSLNSSRQQLNYDRTGNPNISSWIHQTPMTTEVSRKYFRKPNVVSHRAYTVEPLGSYTRLRTATVTPQDVSCYTTHKTNKAKSYSKPVPWYSVLR